MTRKGTLVVVLTSALGLLAGTSQVWAVALIPEPIAAQHGLTRAWAAQVQIDSSRGRLRNMVLDSGTLFVQTDQGVFEAIDAETGKRLWTTQIGDRVYPTFAPGANPKFVALVNGSTLYLLNRFNGKLLWKIQLSGAPSAGPALSLQRVYVPLSDGMIVSYVLKSMKDPLEGLGQLLKDENSTPEKAAAREVGQRDALRLSQEKIPPLTCRGPGRPLAAPLVTRQNADEEYVAWTTERGYLCVGRIDRTREGSFALLYRLHTGAPISGQPCYLPPNPDAVGDSGVIFAASEDGFVYAVRDRDGQQLWRFSTGNPIVESPVVLGRFVLVTNQLGGMYCLDAANMGSQVWWSPEVARVVAASKQKIYAADRTGRLRVLDGRNGTLLDAIATESLPVKLTNSETDRILLASDTGLVQCLHEVGLSQPLVRRLPVAEEQSAPTALETKKPASEQATSDENAEVKKPATPRPSGGTSSGPRLTSPKSGGAKSGTGASGSGRTGTGKRNPRGQFGPAGPAGPGGPDADSGKKGGRRGGRGPGSGGRVPPGYGPGAPGPMGPGGMPGRGGAGPDGG